MAKFKRYTKEDKRKFAKQKQKESKETLNTIYAIATEYSISPESIAEFLEYSNSVYQYSPRNQILIQRQLPGAQLVQSKTRWEEMGYHIRPEFVNKGAVVIRPITRTMYMDEAGNWKPLKGSGKENYEKYKRGELTTKEDFHYWQTTVSAYDITMTDCPAEDYPQIFFWGEKRLSDSMMADVLTKFAEKELECTVNVEPLVGVRGAYYPIENRISLSILNQDTQKASTLAHEIGHAIQYRATTNAAQKSSNLKEVEADCYSILLCNRLGLEIPEGRKSHLARHYKKYIDEMIESGKYDPTADIDGSNNPFFHVMNDVKRVYESFIDSLDAIVREQQGNQIYIQNIQDQVNAVRLSLGSDSPDLKEWEKQFHSEIEQLVTSTQFRNWQKSNDQMRHMSDDELISYLKKEVSDLIRDEQTYFPYENNSVAFILQLQDIPENEESLFTSYRESNAPIIETYDFIYTHNLGEQDLALEDSRLNYAEQTFSDLNSEYMPSGFIGHSLSVSDVVILYSPQNNEMYPYFVDRYGFQQLPDNFITPEFRNKLLADFTVVNEMTAYSRLKESGYDITSLESRGNYLLSTYHPRLLGKKDLIPLDSIDIAHTVESRYRLGNIQYNVMISKDDEVYLGDPERIAHDSYNNSDGSLIHLGKNMATYDLYRSDIEFADSLLTYAIADQSRAEAILNFASDELINTLSSFTETTPLKFDGVPFKDAFEEISPNVKPIATFTYYHPDSTDVAMELEQPLSDEEMENYNVVQSESQEIAVRDWYIEGIARQLDEIQFTLDPNSYQETIGIQYFNRIYNQKRIIADITSGKMTYESIREEISQDIDTYPNEVQNTAHSVINLLEIMDRRQKEIEIGQKERKESIPMTEQEYLDSKGVGSPFGEYQDDKLIGHTNVLRQKSTKKDYEKTAENYWEQRTAAKREYQEKIKSGELRNKTTLERSIERAQGHPDNPSTLAARRILAKRGINWQDLVQNEQPRLEYIISAPDLQNIVTNDPRIALDHFTQTDPPRTFSIRICSDNIDIPDEPLFAGSNQTIDLNMFTAMLKQNIGTDKDTASIDEQLDQLADLVREQYSDSLSLNDNRHEERDFRFHDKLGDLIQNKQVPSEMQDIIRDHESLIIRRLTAFDKRNTYLTKSLTNDEVYQNDDLYLSAIEKTLNADKALDPAGCVKLEGAKLNYTFWYNSQSGGIHGLTDQGNKTISPPYVEILISEDPGFAPNEILSLKDAQKKFAYLDNEAAANLGHGRYNKTNFVLHLSDGSTIRERYDLGDGYGGLIQFIDKTYSEGANYNLQYNRISQKEYDQVIKYKNELVKDLWNAVDAQSAEQELESLKQYSEKLDNITTDKEIAEYRDRVKESRQIIEDRLSRINGRNKWFKEYGKAGELDFGDVPPIKKGKPIEREKNPIKKSSEMKKDAPSSTQNIEVEQ